ncbi:MAG: hypothetical protein GYA17_07275 [Chloroflexi bacterium]|nr:hypothetical protein [Chloroflexota bacterium]
MDERPGCLSGLLKLFLLDKLFDWLQGRAGFGRGGCGGCGCGLILLILFLFLAGSILFGTNWFDLGF